MTNATLEGPRSERLRVTCKCGKTYRARPKLAGKRIRCKVCQSPVRIPSPDSAPELVLPAVPVATPPELQGVRPPKKRARSKSKPKVAAETPTKTKPAPKPLGKRAAKPTPADEPTTARTNPWVNLFLVCVAPTLVLGLAKTVAVSAADAPAAPTDATPKPTYDVSNQVVFAKGETYTVTFKQDDTVKMTVRTGARAGFRPPARNRFGRSIPARPIQARPNRTRHVLLEPANARRGYEATYTTKIHQVDAQGQITAETRTYQRFTDLVNGRAAPVQGLEVLRLRQGSAWRFPPGKAKLPARLTLALKTEARRDEARLRGKHLHTFAGPKEKVAVDQLFDVDLVGVAPVFGLWPSELDVKKSSCIGRITSVERKGAVNWLTVVYVVKLVAHSYQDARCILPLIADFKVTACFPEGGGGESTLALSGTLKGKVQTGSEAYLIDNAATLEVRTQRVP